MDQCTRRYNRKSRFTNTLRWHRYTSPEVNDKDGNGVLDTVQLTEAQEAIEAVEEAKRAVDNKLTEITSDGLVNPSEKAELDKLIEVLDKAKQMPQRN